ncbi:hypothetical protein GCM10022393_31380 [Aquimarina addita]|uniref:Uncharacterized protein n=1 Tax=Aquimarina addita TaxID=870485 RepID=A0ABP6UNP3_9FLAO
MILRITAVTLFTLFLISCQRKGQKEYDPSIIDRQKVDAALGQDISKVLFDHLYVVVDSTTYASLNENNHWKNTYGAIDSGLPDFAPMTESFSTCYLRGHQHYIEILGPNNRFNEPVGKSGIGFSLKNEGEHFHVGMKPKLRKAKDSLLHASEIVKMSLNGEEQTWFKAFYTPSFGTSLHTWYGFYNPGFLDHLHNQKHTSYSREKFLEGIYENHKLFHSIKSIRLTCTLNDFRRIAQELGYLKCKLIKEENEVYTIKSGDINIVIEFSDKIEYSRITQITCNLNKKDNTTRQLGNLTITNNGKVSIWDFNQLHKNNSY